MRTEGASRAGRAMECASVIRTLSRGQSALENREKRETQRNGRGKRGRNVVETSCAHVVGVVVVIVVKQVIMGKEEIKDQGVGCAV